MVLLSKCEKCPKRDNCELKKKIEQLVVKNYAFCVNECVPNYNMARQLLFDYTFRFKPFTLFEDKYGARILVRPHLLDCRRVVLVAPRGVELDLDDIERLSRALDALRIKMMGELENEQ